MAEKVMRSPILFFDSNPIGRITTRFSKDMTLMDVMFPNVTVLVTQGILRSIIVMITVGIINPYLFIAALFAMVYMNWVMKTASASMVQVLRMEQKFGGPINTCM